MSAAYEQHLSRALKHLIGAAEALALARAQSHGDAADDRVPAEVLIALVERQKAGTLA